MQQENKQNIYVCMNVFSLFQPLNHDLFVNKNHVLWRKFSVLWKQNFPTLERILFFAFHEKLLRTKTNRWKICEKNIFSKLTRTLQGYKKICRNLFAFVQYFSHRCQPEKQFSTCKMNFSAFGSFPTIHHQFSTAVTSSSAPPSTQVWSKTSTIDRL